MQFRAHPCDRVLLLDVPIGATAEEQWTRVVHAPSALSLIVVVTAAGAPGLSHQRCYILDEFGEKLLPGAGTISQELCAQHRVRKDCLPFIDGRPLLCMWLPAQCL